MGTKFRTTASPQPAFVGFADRASYAVSPLRASIGRKVEPYLDAIVCYASDMGEHEPNKLAANARAALAKARSDVPKPRHD